jgi:alpha-L-arabinofuranosidase
MTLPTVVNSPVVQPPPAGGKVGVGTWLTQAEFKDMKVTAADGTVLFASDAADPKKGWSFHGGDWKADDGTLRQDSNDDFIRALAGDVSWTDYTFTLKAKKISGNEGFLILFHINGDEDRTWWNIGGWGNTRDGIEFGSTLDSKPSNIETGHWYDIKVEVKGTHVKCYLDGKVIHDLDMESAKQVVSLYANAAHDDKTGDVILKVVNVNTNAMETQIDLTGAKALTGKGTAIVLTSDKSTDENDLENPTRVSPKTEDVDFSGSSLTRSFPANSFTVLRLHAGN